MFTGIVEELGRVRAIHRREGGARLEIDATTVDPEPGESDWHAARAKRMPPATVRSPPNPIRSK